MADNKNIDEFGEFVSTEKGGGDEFGEFISTSGVGEKKKPISELSKPSPLKPSLEEKSFGSAYAPPDIQSLSKSDSSTLESTPSLLDITKSSYSVTGPQDLYKQKEVEGLKTVEKLKTITEKAKDQISLLDKKQEPLFQTLNETKPLLEDGYKKLIEQQEYINSVPDDSPTKDFLRSRWQEEADKFNLARAEYDKMSNQFNAIQRAKPAIAGIADEAKKWNDLQKSGGEIFASEAWNNFVPNTVAGFGDLVESLGVIGYDQTSGRYVNMVFDDAIENAKTPQEKQQLETVRTQLNDKITAVTDNIGEGLREFGKGIATEDIHQAALDEHEVAQFTGALVGNVASFIIPAKTLGMAGKATKGLAFITEASATANSAYDQATAVGMDKKDKAYFTAAIAIPSGVLGQWGADNIIDNAVGNRIMRETIKEAAQKLGTKEISKEVIFDTVGETFKEVSKRILTKGTLGNALKSAGSEGLAGAGQAAVELTGKEIYNIKEGEEKFKTEWAEDIFKGAALEALGGGLIGGTIGTFSEMANNPSIYNKVMELKVDADKLDLFKTKLNESLKSGQITNEEYQNIKSNVNALIEVDNKIPSAIVNLEKRFEAVNLLAEKERLENEMEGKDKILSKNYQSEIDAIDIKLQKIANDRSSYKIPRRDLAAKKETLAEGPSAIDTRPESQPSISFTQDDQEALDLLLIKDEAGRITDAQKIELNNLKAKQDAFSKQKTNEVDVRQQAGDGKTMGEGNTQPEIIAGKEEIVNEGQQEIAPTEERNKTVTFDVQEDYSPEKITFIENKLNELKADEEAQFNDAFMPIYTKYFANEYDKTQQVTDNQGAGVEGQNQDSGVLETTSVEKPRVRRAGVPKTKQKVRDTRKIQAGSVQVNTPYDIALQYFVNRGKIKYSAIKEIFGEKAEGEKRARVGLQNKDTGKGLDELANFLWEQDDRFTTQEYKDAIEQAIIENNTDTQMAERINAAYSKEKEEGDYLTAEDREYYNQEMAAEADDIWEQMSDDEKQAFVNSLEEVPADILKPSVKEKVKKIADQIRKSGKFFDDKAMSAFPLLREAWKAAHEIAALTVEAGGTIAEATIKAIESFKNSEYYKNLSEKGKKNIEKELLDSINDSVTTTKPVVNDGKKPSRSAGERVRALATELSEAKSIPQQIKDKLKDAGLTSDIFSHKEAKEIADYLIKERGVEDSVALADKELKGSVKFFVFGAAIDHYSKMINEATTLEEKERLAELGAEVGAMADSQAEDAGRYISAIGEYYKNHPDIIAKRELKKLAKANERVLEKKVDTSKKIQQVQREFEVLQKELNKKIEEGVEAEINRINEALPVESKRRSDKAIAALEKFQSKIRANRYSDATGIVAAVDTAISVIVKAIKVGRSVSEAIELGVKHINSKMKGEKWDEKSFRADMQEGFAEQGVEVKKTKGESSLRNEQEKILNKYFPKKRAESETKRKQIHEKIIDQYNAGVFEGGKNKAGESFESLFYEKLGIVNPNSPEVKAKIKGFAERMNRAPEGSKMWRDVNNEMLNYIADIAYKTKLQSGASKLMSMWYANVLSSPATHLRNLQFNAIQSLVAQPLLLMQKAIIDGDKKSIAKIGANLIKGLNKGRIESAHILKTGKGSRFDNVITSDVLERSKRLKWLTLPGRGLRAEDVLSTSVLYEMKIGELARNMVKKENPNWTNDQVSAKINELVGETQERRMAAREQVEKELEQFYGENWRNEKGIKNIQAIREFEVMQQTIPEDIKEAAIAWSKRNVLTKKPTGLLGVLADKISGINDEWWFTKFVVPFVNVPINAAQALIDKTPIGLVKYFRKQEGFGKNATELTADERREILLKVINYTIATLILAFLNGEDEKDGLVITGEQTGDYTDNKGIVKGGGLRPYTVNYNGKELLNYKTTPWAAMFLIPGYIRDFKVYGKEAKKSSALDIALNYLMFMSDASSMQQMAAIFDAVKDDDKPKMEKLLNGMAKTTSGLIPYSGAIKFFNNNIKSIVGAEDKRPIDTYELLFRDIPGIEEIMETRTDHFGEPVKESLEVPMLPLGENAGFEEMLGVGYSKYYKLTTDHNYKNRYANDRVLYVNGEEKEISKKELDKLNKKRGQLVKEALDSKNVFQLRHDEDEPPVVTNESEMTTYDYLNTLDNEEFKEKMNKLYNEAFKKAKLDLYGEKVGVSQKEIDNYYEKVKIEMDKGYSKSDAEIAIESPFEIEKEAYDKRGKILIEVDNY